MKPVILTILDGWGLRDAAADNAPMLAHTPTMDRLTATCPNATLITHGPDVGLPTGQMGNSEVGHTNIGAGRVVAMDLGQIDLAIEDETFFKNPHILAFADQVRLAGGTAHVIGLTSDGGVHAHSDHLLATCNLLTDQGLSVAVHVITDGRDVPPASAREQVSRFEQALPKGARIVTVSGRYYAMDRDTRWERVEKAYRCIAEGQGARQASALTGIAASYANGVNDEFILPFVVGDFDGIHAHDGLFFANFRADRAREILSAIGDPTFDGFKRVRKTLSGLLGMVDYSQAHDKFMTTAFPKQVLVNTLGEWVAKHDKTQFRLAETEKYPHVTFFLNGGREAPEPNEDRFMPKSPKVATYDLQPEMSAQEVTDKFVEAIDHGYDLIVVNYANPDMVGHTGDLQAAMRACEAVDAGLARVLDRLAQTDGAMLIIADHGNCETMVDPDTGAPHTAHTTNPVPAILFGGPEGVTLRDGRLADVAPTLLQLMELPQPAEMTGKSLIT
jgi:2,3-bisphosphoglycerate-independent phosphoglycerate mutase